MQPCNGSNVHQVFYYDSSTSQIKLSTPSFLRQHQQNKQDSADRKEQQQQEEDTNLCVSYDVDGLITGITDNAYMADCSVSSQETRQQWTYNETSGAWSNNEMTRTSANERRCLDMHLVTQNLYLNICYGGANQMFLIGRNFFPSSIL